MELKILRHNNKTTRKSATNELLFRTKLKGWTSLLRSIQSDFDLKELQISITNRDFISIVAFCQNNFFLLKNWFIERIRMKNIFVWLFLNRADSSIQSAMVIKNAIKYLIVWYFAKFEERNKNSLAVTDIKLIIYSIARQLTTQKGWERERKRVLLGKRRRKTECFYYNSRVRESNTTTTPTIKEKFIVHTRIMNVILVLCSLRTDWESKKKCQRTIIKRLLII